MVVHLPLYRYFPRRGIELGYFFEHFFHTTTTYANSSLRLQFLSSFLPFSNVSSHANKNKIRKKTFTTKAETEKESRSFKCPHGKGGNIQKHKQKRWQKSVTYNVKKAKVGSGKQQEKHPSLPPSLPPSQIKKGEVCERQY